MSLTVAERIRKRRKCPVDIDGETVYVRGLTWSEYEQIIPIRDEDYSTGVAIGFCLLNDDGSQAYQIAKDEDLKTFGLRVLTELNAEVGVGLHIAARIMKATQSPPTAEAQEAIIKN